MPKHYKGMKSRTEKHSKFLPSETGVWQWWGEIIAEIEMQMTQLHIYRLGNLQLFYLGTDGRDRISIGRISVASIVNCECVVAPGFDKVNFEPNGRLNVPILLSAPWTILLRNRLWNRRDTTLGILGIVLMCLWSYFSVTYSSFVKNKSFPSIHYPRASNIMVYCLQVVMILLCYATLLVYALMLQTQNCTPTLQLIMTGFWRACISLLVCM